ncbi:hypothetical protein [Streptomyces sp. NPDC002215]|uniref:hypothetical protein n=1 Tax=Streptomyces sp. NPDC002215 TaxID=3154412 RepID=UPI00332F3E9E
MNTVQRRQALHRSGGTPISFVATRCTAVIIANSAPIGARAATESSSRTDTDGSPGSPRHPHCRACDASAGGPVRGRPALLPHRFEPGAVGPA